MRYFVFIIVVGTILASGTYVFAQDATELTLEFPEFASSSSPADFVNNFYLWALGIAGTLAVIRVIFGGVKYVVSAGNVAQQGDARDIITNAVWGLLLLGGAYLILNTINPQLVELRNPGLTPIPAATSTPDGGVIIGQDADRLLAASLIGSASFSGDCDAIAGIGTSAGDVLKSYAENGATIVCNSSCSCGVSDSIRLSTTMLQTLVQFVNEYGSKHPVIQSLTGGRHSSESLHYRGRAADLTMNPEPRVWGWAVAFLKKNGASRVFCEGGGKGFVGSCDVKKSAASCPDDQLIQGCVDMFNAGVSGMHIHAEW